MLTAIEHGSVGPKRMAKAISESKTVLANDKKCFVYLAVRNDCNLTTIRLYSLLR